MRCDQCPEVHCDKHRIGQVLRNVFENSLSVAPFDSKVFVDCKTIVGTQNGEPRVEVCIADQGPGIDPSQRVRIFEPFFTTKTRGTGLGMSICQRIIEADGSRIAVSESCHSSERGKATGATIVFGLPIG